MLDGEDSEVETWGSLILPVMGWRLMKTLLVLVASFTLVSNILFIMNLTSESKYMTQRKSGNLAGFEKVVAGSKFIESYPHGESQVGYREVRGKLKHQ